MLKDISVKAKLSILVAISIVSIVVIGWRGLSATSSINDSLNTIVNVNVTRIKSAEEMTIALVGMQRAEKNMILATTPEEMDKYEKAYDRYQADFKKWASQMETVVSEQNRPKLERCQEITTEDYDKTARSIFAMTRASNNEEATRLSQTQGRKYIDECEGLMNELIQSNEDNLSATSKQTDESYAFARNLIIGLSLFALIGLLSIAYLVTGIITRSVQSVQAGLNSFFRFLNREVDRAEPIRLDSKDEFGQMADVINHNIAKIEQELQQDRGVIADIVNVANEVKKGKFHVETTTNTTNPNLQELKKVFDEVTYYIDHNVARDLSLVLAQIDAYKSNDFTHRIPNAYGRVAIALNDLGDAVSMMLGNALQNGVDLQNDAGTLKQAVESLSTASNQQAASLEETAAAMEEMTSNVQNNAQKANDMAHMAAQTDQSAKEGAALANRTSAAMTEIQTATNSINNAVAIIENIAFQTNILSLNAAVEAATAGEAGKGFAVVAQEVRNLANRSADAAKEIKALAEQAAAKSNEGMDIANELTKGFEVIAEKIEQTTMLVQDVSNASREQMQGIGQINTAVTQLDQMTQENAKIAAEADAIANATIQKAQAMVADASSKNFAGKNQVHAAQPVKTVAVKVPKASHSAAPKPALKAPPAAKPAKHDGDDVWESF